MIDHTATQTPKTERTGREGPHQFAEALLAGVLVALKELTAVIQRLAEAQEGHGRMDVRRR